MGRAGRLPHSYAFAVRSFKTEPHPLPVWQQRDVVGSRLELSGNSFLQIHFGDGFLSGNYGTPPSRAGCRFKISTQIRNSPSG